MKRWLVFLVALLSVVFVGTVAAEGPEGLQYVSPRPGAQLVSAGTTIAIRLGEPIRADTMEARLFGVAGEESGAHQGVVVLADDGLTVIFKPTEPFLPGEKVQVTIGRGLTTTSGRVFAGISYSFAVSPKTATTAPAAWLESEGNAVAGEASIDGLPADAPVVDITTPANGTGDGYIFLTPMIGFFRTYLLIVDDNGEPIYYQRMDGQTLDLKKQPNGMLTYFNGGSFHVMDNSYQIVDTWHPGNGYSDVDADGHDLQLLPNGHALLHIYDQQPYDTTTIVAGGWTTATVDGLVIQELDTNKNVVFEWRSWDHFLITDTYYSLTAAHVDYVHANALELDYDGNILISSRHLSEITKIDRSTGDIIWRLGGKNNQFAFVNDTAPYFNYQHDIRRLSNGHITLFDNHNGLASPSFSRAVEYELDEQAMTATLVWEYINTPLTYGAFMGNVQRLANGNSVIGWGGAGLVTEVTADKTKAFEFSLKNGMTYRAYRFPWHGYPVTQPSLKMETGSETVTLVVSWNGATDISAYRVYAGSAPHPTTLVATQDRTGFETRIELPRTAGECLYYRVMPIDTNGWETRYSNEVTTWSFSYLPVLLH